MPVDKLIASSVRSWPAIARCAASRSSDRRRATGRPPGLARRVAALARQPDVDRHRDHHGYRHPGESAFLQPGAQTDKPGCAGRLDAARHRDVGRQHAQRLTTRWRWPRRRTPAAKGGVLVTLNDEIHRTRREQGCQPPALTGFQEPVSRWDDSSRPQSTGPTARRATHGQRVRHRPRLRTAGLWRSPTAGAATRQPTAYKAFAEGGARAVIHAHRQQLGEQRWWCRPAGAARQSLRSSLRRVVAAASVLRNAEQPTTSTTESSPTTSTPRRRPGRGGLCRPGYQSAAAVFISTEAEARHDTPKRSHRAPARPLLERNNNELSMEARAERRLPATALSRLDARRPAVTIALSLSAWVIALALGSLWVCCTRAQMMAVRPGRHLCGVFETSRCWCSSSSWYFAAEVLPSAWAMPSSRISTRSPSSSCRRCCAWRFHLRAGVRAGALGHQRAARGQKKRRPGAGFTLPQTYRHVLSADGFPPGGAAASRPSF